MKKNLFYAVIAIGMLANCAENEYVGEVSPNLNAGGENQAIVFNSGAKKATRADFTGADAAEKLNNNFVFMGTKTIDAVSIVFDHYNANWVNNTANTTESNSNDWEYVGYTPASTTSLPTGAKQSIKYWDFAASQYDFAAYSLGKGANPTSTAENNFAKATAIDFSKLGTAVTSGTPVYTLKGTVDKLKACYISDLVTAYNQSGVSDFGEVVTFSFRSLAAKIRIAFFETVPGYSVKNIQFYDKVEYDASTGTFGTTATANNTPKLLTANDQATLPSGEGTMSVYFPTVGFSSRPASSTPATDYNKAHVTFTQAENTTAASTLTFDGLADWEAAESLETANDNPATGWIGRVSNKATYAGGLVNGAGKYYTILPCEAGTNLMLRIKYTLVSTDGSGETINVNNATAVIPAELAQWSPNYAYTYIFKISDMTNGTTGVDASTNKPVMGLTPITLNAVVVDSEDGVQETITTVSEPSITTYAKGKVVTVNDEYVADIPIYVIVNNGTSNVTLSTTNAKLYTATATNAIQGITEETVDNALRYGNISTVTNTDDTYTVTDAENGTLVVTDVTPSDWLVKKIDATDSPTGNEIVLSTSDNKAAKFAPTSSGTYVFRYIETQGTDGEYSPVSPVKLSTNTTYYTYNGTTYTQVTTVTGDEIVKNDPVYYIESGGVYTAVEPAKLTANTTYYTSSRGAGKFVATGSEIVNGENKYYECTTPATAGKYHYKIIKVQ